jgi:PII-like signaling protein
MPSRRTAKLLRLHISESDRFEGKSLHEAILDRCMEIGIAGATVFRGLEGYGETAEIHRRRLMRNDQPIVVVIIDEPEAILRLLPIIESMMATGLVAISEVTTIRVSETNTA